MIRSNLIATVATVALLVGTAGIARAQDNPNEQQKRPANERIEKNAPGEAPGQRKTDAERKQGAADQTGQAEPKREGETRTGQAEPPKREDEMKPGQAARPEKRAEEKRVDDKPAGKAETTEKRAEDKRTGQVDRKDNNAGERAKGVRVEGNVHISEERAARVSAELMRRAHPDNVNIAMAVGGRMPEEVVLEPVPTEIVEFAPEYRGYDYVYANDRFVFVQPDSREIVGMIDVGDNAVAQEEPVLSRPKPCPVD